MAESQEKPKKPRGFALMSAERRKQVAAEGGKAAHRSGKAHKFKSGEEAQEAGRKGGRASQSKGTGHKFDSEEAKAASQKKQDKPNTASGNETGQEEGMKWLSQPLCDRLLLRSLLHYDYG